MTAKHVVVDAPFAERMDARALFEKIAARHKAGAESFELSELAADLGWPNARVVVAMHVLERAGLVTAPAASRGSS